MHTVVIAREVSDEKMGLINNLLYETILHDPNWSGAEFQTERGDYTCMPDTNSFKATSLFYGIQRIIAGE